MKADWKTLFADIKGRFLTVLAPSRLLYFISVVIGIGGLGAWRALPNFDLLRANLATYAIGISAAAAVELVLPGSTSPAMRMLAISLGILACAISLTYQQLHAANLVWLAAICGWLLWIFSSSSNANIGSPSPLAATGGDTGAVAGDLSGFQMEEPA